MVLALSKIRFVLDRIGSNLVGKVSLVTAYLGQAIQTPLPTEIILSQSKLQAGGHWAGSGVLL